MVVSEGLLMKLSDIINRHEARAVGTCVSQKVSAIADHSDDISDKINSATLKAQGEWFGAIAALEELLLSQVKAPVVDSSTCQGLILSAPTPILCHQTLTSQFQTGVFTPQAGQNLILTRRQLPAACTTESKVAVGTMAELPMFPKDPIATEQFCLVLTPHFGLLAVLGQDNLGLPAFQFSFEPEVIHQGWLALRSRLIVADHPQLCQLDGLVQHFPPPIPDYRLVTQFSRLLLHHLPQIPPITSAKHQSIHFETAKNQQKSSLERPNDGSDVALLQH
jgi:hypothetical protein